MAKAKIELSQNRPRYDPELLENLKASGDLTDYNPKPESLTSALDIVNLTEWYIQQSIKEPSSSEEVSRPPIWKSKQPAGIQIKIFSESIEQNMEKVVDMAKNASTFLPTVGGPLTILFALESLLKSGTSWSGVLGVSATAAGTETAARAADHIGAGKWAKAGASALSYANNAATGFAILNDLFYRSNSFYIGEIAIEIYCWQDAFKAVAKYGLEGEKTRFDFKDYVGDLYPGFAADWMEQANFGGIQYNYDFYIDDDGELLRVSDIGSESIGTPWESSEDE